MNSNQPSEVESPIWLAQRATVWQLRTRTLELSRRPLLMGIVNVTPDSFSDGGRFFEPQAAVAHALQLVADGADLLDIGGESTRPGSRPISLQEEMGRVLPVLDALCREVAVPVSIDTSKAEVARAGIQCGVEIINDITALRGDTEMIGIAVQTGAAVCAMHMQGNPQTMQINPQYGNVVNDVYQFFAQTRDRIMAAGIPRSKICLDSGIGFGKTREHNVDLLANCWRFHELGCPLLVGHSRKSFLAETTGEQTIDRTSGTVAISCALMAQGVQLLRVHDVAAHRKALALFDACT